MFIKFIIIKNYSFRRTKVIRQIIVDINLYQPRRFGISSGYIYPFNTIALHNNGCVQIRLQPSSNFGFTLSGWFKLLNYSTGSVTYTLYFQGGSTENIVVNPFNQFFVNRNNVIGITVSSSSYIFFLHKISPSISFFSNTSSQLPIPAPQSTSNIDSNPSKLATNSFVETFNISY